MSLKDRFLRTATTVEICRTLKGADMDIRGLANHTTKHVPARPPAALGSNRSVILTGCLTDGPECSFCVLGSALGDVIQFSQDVVHQQGIERNT